jgi:signal transduction histidine kinase
MNNICKYALENSRVYLTLEVKGVTGANASESGANTGTIANTVTNIGTSGANNSRQVLITFKNTSKTELDMPPEELMERFVRGDQSRNTEGNGLGLSIARSLTELQNGTFDIFIDGDLFKVVLSFPVKE